jgi:predicted O-methyltransferase YrrM
MMTASGHGWTLRSRRRPKFAAQRPEPAIGVEAESIARREAMFGTVTLAYARKHPFQLLRAVAQDPPEAWTALIDRYMARVERRTPRPEHAADADWEPRLRALTGISPDSPSVSEFRTLWPEVIDLLRTKGIEAGPLSFGHWNDGDAGLTRAIWCLVRQLKPRCVVETGVAHGLTSRFILEALQMNGAGRLWSIDLPPFEPALRGQVGVAVGDRFSDRWTYIAGSSRRKLPRLLAELGEVDLFVHDSLHSERNVSFELASVWPVLRPGGAIVVDDIDINGAFWSFTQGMSDLHAMVCEAEPLHPDLRRFNNKGLFGIILKHPAGTGRTA